MTTADLLDLGFLIAEDDKVVRTMLSRTLRKAGARQVLEAEDGVSAVKVLKDSGDLVQCIISDLNMKPMHGLFLLQAVRSGVTRLPRDAAFLLFTSHSDAHFMRTAFKLDAHAFLSKPMMARELVAKVHRAMADPIELNTQQYYAAIALPGGVGGPALTMDPDPEAEVDLGPGVARPMPTLRPDQVLARDLKADGQLLLKAGAVLTASTIRRLNDLALIYPELDNVWVVSPRR